MDISYCSPRRRRSCTAEACINGLDPVPHSCILSLASAIRSAAAVDWSCAGTKSRCNSSSGDRLGQLSLHRQALEINFSVVTEAKH
ncbi:hypothetical protein RchiOBHm_Chr2g0115491 [Rosa chinensis]|uniref:Uncharacterized protein n=1 Tax=Rosa chinensis TaxID=74649 RepID=A0A2P6RQZ7_ROSCH|nr:hypothetical protein RchiOBHm_Chr2g0115491 [Rosa chinensis]